MTPDQYPVPAADVVALLKGHIACKGESREHHAPIPRRALAALLKVPASSTGLFARQLQHMQKNFAEHRICFQHYPTGWIYRPLTRGR